MEKEFDILTGAKRLDEVRFSKIRTVMDMVADLRAKGEEVLSLSAGDRILTHRLLLKRQ